MSRPIGVTVVVLLILSSSFVTVVRGLTSPGLSRRHDILLALTLLAAVSVFAAEALWSLRRHAFLMFILWTICAMFTTVLYRSSTTTRVHAIQLFAPMVCAGLVCAIAALYLRRVL